MTKALLTLPESYTTYTQQDLVWLGMLKNTCGVESMCRMNENFNEETAGLPVRSAQKMVKCLIRSKAFLKNRLSGKYWTVILDRTGLFRFKKDSG